MNLQGGWEGKAVSVIQSCTGNDGLRVKNTYWQSIRSVIPPCPGILSPKSLMLKALLKPEAKNPPNGAASEAKDAMTRRWKW